MGVQFWAVGQLDWIGRDLHRERLNEFRRRVLRKAQDERLAEPSNKGRVHVSRWDDVWPRVDDLREGWYRFGEEFEFPHGRWPVQLLANVAEWHDARR
jgi:hypothetical protein